MTRLTEAQQRYLAATVYDGEVRSGGHSQYFFNSSGDHWSVALEGLLAEFDDRYGDDTDDLDLRLARYVLEHAADFRPE